MACDSIAFTRLLHTANQLFCSAKSVRHGSALHYMDNQTRAAREQHFSRLRKVCSIVFMAARELVKEYFKRLNSTLVTLKTVTATHFGVDKRPPCARPKHFTTDNGIDGMHYPDVFM